MEEFALIFHKLFELGFTPLNIVLMVMLYFIGSHSGIFPKFWKSSTEDEEEEKKEPTLADLHREVSKLSGYFNHETTTHLEELKAKQDKTHEVVKEIRAKQDEFDRFGIRVRNQ